MPLIIVQPGKLPWKEVVRSIREGRPPRTKPRPMVPVGVQIRPGLIVTSVERKPAPFDDIMAWWYRVSHV